MSPNMASLHQLQQLSLQQQNQGLQHQGSSGLHSSASLQGLRLSMSQTPQPIGPPGANQPANSDSLGGPTTYSLFKAPPSSLPGGQTINGQVSSPPATTQTTDFVGARTCSLPLLSTQTDARKGENKSTAKAFGAGTERSRLCTGTVVGLALRTALEDKRDMQNKLLTGWSRSGQQ